MSTVSVSDYGTNICCHLLLFLRKILTTCPAADRGLLLQLLKDFKENILGLGIVKRLRATIAKLKEELADLMRTNDRLTKDLQYVIEDRNKYKYQLQDQEYYLTDEERNEIAEKIIQRKDLELENGNRTFEKDDLDLADVFKRFFICSKVGYLV